MAPFISQYSRRTSAFISMVGTWFGRSLQLFPQGSCSGLPTGLIEQADTIALSGGGAALETGILRRQMIALGPRSYQNAGFQSSTGTPKELETLKLYTTVNPSGEAAKAIRLRAGLFAAAA